MNNLQAMIDAAFGAPEAPRAPQQPSEAASERNRAFAERAMKIETLREARLGTPRESKNPILFEIVRHRGHWRILHCAKYSSPFADQTAAIAAARKSARKKRDLGHMVEIILRRTDGNSVAQSIDDPQSASA